MDDTRRKQNNDGNERLDEDFDTRSDQRDSQQERDQPGQGRSRDERQRDVDSDDLGITPSRR